MAVKFGDRKFYLNLWKTLKTHISRRIFNASKQTHYVCNYCRNRLNVIEMPCRCVLSRLELEPVSKELKLLSQSAEHY